MDNTRIIEQLQKNQTAYHFLSRDLKAYLDCVNKDRDVVYLTLHGIWNNCTSGTTYCDNLVYRLKYSYKESNLQERKDSKMTEKEAYKVLHDSCGIKKGDTVKILRKVDLDHKLGWDVAWPSEMDRFVGKTYKVEYDSGSDGFRLENSYYFPFYVLELVKKKEIDIKFFCDGKDVTDELSEESKRNLAKSF